MPTLVSGQSGAAGDPRDVQDPPLPRPPPHGGLRPGAGGVRLPAAGGARPHPRPEEGVLQCGGLGGGPTCEVLGGASQKAKWEQQELCGGRWWSTLGPRRGICLDGTPGADVVKLVKDSVNVPVLVNGNVLLYEDIGRGAAPPPCNARYFR